MGKSIAFYAPLKSPNHKTPSGDRTIARGIMAALQDVDWVGEVTLASEFRSRDGAGDNAVQNALIETAKREIDALLNLPLPDAWVTYHNYYKAPDLIGPAICMEAGIPYFVIEASKSPKRALGPWANFSNLADAATDAAKVVFYLTQRDLPQLQASKPPNQSLIHLPPFLNQNNLPAAKIADGSRRLLAIGMFREGDKLVSYTSLAEALQWMTDENWHLQIIGSGPCEPQIRALFAGFGERVEFLGELSRTGVLDALCRSDVFVWPGVNEAFGMVYLEAQSVGLPVVAENRPGVRDVVAPHGFLVPPHTPSAFADAIDAAFQAKNTHEIRMFIQDHHLRPAASLILAETLSQYLGEPL